MRNALTRVITSLVVLFSGVVMFTGAAISNSYRGETCSDVGVWFLAIGGLMIAAEYVVAWFQYQSKKEQDAANKMTAIFLNATNADEKSGPIS